MWLKVLITVILIIFILGLSAYTGLIPPLLESIGGVNDNTIQYLPPEMVVVIVIIAVAVCVQIAYSFYE